MNTNVCVLDTLPPQCSLISEFDGIGHVRFRAQRTRGGLLDDSQWSGWYSLDDAPIQLSWVAFDFDE